VIGGVTPHKRYVGQRKRNVTTVSLSVKAKEAAVCTAALEKMGSKPGLKNYSNSFTLSRLVFEMILSIIPYIPTNRIVLSPMENDSGLVSTTSLNNTYTRAKHNVDAMIMMKYNRKLGFIISYLVFL
jgi:hypothetical protein